MIDRNLLESIENYIAANYNDLSWLAEAKKQGFKFSISGDLSNPIGEEAEPVGRTEKIIRKLKDSIGMAGNYFSDYLFALIKEKNLSEVEVYKKAHLDRRVFSKIRNQKSYMPSKLTVLAIAIAMKLNSKETNTLLQRAGYALTDARKEDLIINYFIENQIYDIFLINEVLDHYECPTIGD